MIHAHFEYATENPVCVCGRVIPDTAVYYGFPLDPDNDAPMAWINEWHDLCLAEWGWMRDDSEFGITHATTYCGVEPIDPALYTLAENTGDEDIRPS